MHKFLRGIVARCSVPFASLLRRFLFLSFLFIEYTTADRAKCLDIYSVRRQPITLLTFLIGFYVVNSFEFSFFFWIAAKFQFSPMQQFPNQANIHCHTVYTIYSKNICQIFRCDIHSLTISLPHFIRQ